MAFSNLNITLRRESYGVFNVNKPELLLCLTEDCRQNFLAEEKLVEVLGSQTGLKKKIGNSEGEEGLRIFEFVGHGGGSAFWNFPKARSGQNVHAACGYGYFLESPIKQAIKYGKIW